MQKVKMNMLTTQDFERYFSNYTPQAQDTTNQYAVLVPLVEREGELHLLFEVRSSTLRRQPNEVCFPGGKIEAGESAYECALRETGEELGIPASQIRVISELDYVAHYSNFIVYPVLAQIEEEAVSHMQLSKDEVRDAFLVPLSFFQAHPPTLYVYDLIPSTDQEVPYESIGLQEPYPFRTGKVTIPVYDKYGGYVVWGLTGRIVRWLLKKISNGPAKNSEDMP
jgi:8-oxo-dGTP pyrophosphatase MutT (NUDIX family)